MAEPNAPSLEERLAAKFGGGLPKGESPAPPVREPPPAPQDDPETPAEPGEPDEQEVEWEGNRYTLPKPIREALMRESDYRHKTMGLAETQRALDHTRELMTRAQTESAFRDSIQQETRQLAVIEAYLSEANKMNWSAMSVEQMIRARAEMDQVRDQKEKLTQYIGSKQDQFNKDMQAKLAELRAKSREIAAKSIPGFSDELDQSIRSYAKTEGLSEAEIDSVLLDPRSAKVLWKAMQWTKVKAGASKAADTAGRAVRPGAASERMPQDVRAKLEYRKDMSHAKTSGEKARLIEDRLANASIFNRGKQ